MSETPLLALPLIAAEQAQKHVTLNEALTALDALVQLAVKDRDLTAPPGSPAEGDRYIVAAGASGAWAGRDLDIAARQGGVWNFLAPKEGWRCWIEDESVLAVFDGAAWDVFDGGAGERPRVRAATTAHIAIATALNAGDTLDGVTLVGGDHVLVKNQSAADENGVYAVGASPARVAAFDRYDDHPGVLIAIMEGTVNHDTLWLCTSNKGGVLETDPLVFASATIPPASETAPGIVELASFSETREGTLAERAVPPSALGPFAAFSAFMSSTQSVANNTVTVVQCPTELFDIGAHYDNATYRWTPPAGLVCLVATFRFVSSGGVLDQKRYNIGFKKNGAAFLSFTAQTSGVDAQGECFTAIDQCDGDDYYEFYVQHLIGASASIENGSFQGFRIR